MSDSTFIFQMKQCKTPSHCWQREAPGTAPQQLGRLFPPDKHKDCNPQHAKCPGKTHGIKGPAGRHFVTNKNTAPYKLGEKSNWKSDSTTSLTHGHLFFIPTPSQHITVVVDGPCCVLMSAFRMALPYLHASNYNCF